MMHSVIAKNQAQASSSLLAVENLSVRLPTAHGMATVVDDVSFKLPRGSTLGIVGESGSGKSMSCSAILRLLPRGAEVQGSIWFDGSDLLSLKARSLRRIRGAEIGYIFQDPMSSLTPSVPVGAQIVETLRAQQQLSRRAARDRAIELLDLVGIPAAHRRVHAYPHEFSGGMRQRVLVAIAISCSPQLLIADEPTTALDVTIQAQVLDLLRDMKDTLDLSIIFVSHDLAVISDICDDVVVMYAGEIVEKSPVDTLFQHPQHPYTESLLRAVRRPRAGELPTIRGVPPSLGNWPEGCRFAPRCEYLFSACSSHPPLMNLNDQEARCFLHADEGDRTVGTGNR